MSALTGEGSGIDEYIARLRKTFASTSSKREAHALSRPTMLEMARDPAVLSTAIRRHIKAPGALNRRHYPVVAFELEVNPVFELVMNCWIPLPDRSTSISTKAIHHHGPMLLTTATAFGPGYEHWALTRRKPIDRSADLFAMELVEHGHHGLHDVAFVDAYVAHVPIYPEALTITLCLWSSSTPTTWRDHLKRVPWIRRRAATLRRLAQRAGLAGPLELKVDDYLDYYPADRGFVGMKDRQEFPRTNNRDYLYSLFAIIQTTGNAHLADELEQVLARGGVDDPHLVRELIAQLRDKRPIEARLSPEHYGVPSANFTTGDIERALNSQPAP